MALADSAVYGPPSVSVKTYDGGGTKLGGFILHDDSSNTVHRDIHHSGAVT